MKKSIAAITLGMIISTTATAQTATPGTGSDGKAVSGEIQAPDIVGLKWLSDSAKFMAERIHSIEVSQVVNRMNQEGLKTGLGMLTISGAAAYGTIDGYCPDTETLKTVGKNSSWQVVPFSVSITEDGRTHISFSAYAIRNIIGVNNPISYATSNDLPKYLSDVDFISYEYDDQLTYTNVEKHKLSIVQFNYKFGLVQSKNKKQYLKFTLAGGGGFNFKTKIDIGSEVLEGHDLVTDLNAKAGLEYNARIGKRINLDISNAVDTNYSKFNFSKPALDKLGNISTDEYGYINYQNENMDKFRHMNVYLNSQITLSKKVSKDSALSPKRLSIGVKMMNPLIKDKLKSDLGKADIDMGQYRQLGEVKIGFHF